jgi:hypothetical protein
MGIKPNTTISYIRALYTRLDISGRHELLARLAGADEAAESGQFSDVRDLSR